MFTFKKEPMATGLSTVGYSKPNTHIKLHKFHVGHICAPNWTTKDNLWTIRLMVCKEPTTESPCPWRWVQLKASFETEPDARAFLKRNFEALIERYSLYKMGDNGEPRVVTGWTPGNERSTGRVSLKTEGDMWSHDFFPSIIGAIITTAD